MLKLYLYGYLQGIRSSRTLESETRRNLEVIWLLEGSRPCYKSIADFRKNAIRRANHRMRFVPQHILPHCLFWHGVQNLF
ncbi:MAG: transposase [Methylococcales bacterium]|nr:transposase [Methylococcales bacterium]